jgi:hypothetical protein
MHFSYSEQQQVAADALTQMLSRFADLPVHAEAWLPGAALDREIEASGFHEILADPDLGGISAIDLIVQVGCCAAPVEIGASTLVRPRLCPDAPRPLALVRGDRPVRFGAEARTALIDDGERVLRLDVQPGDFAPLDTLFAYPLARLAPEAFARAAPLEQPDAVAILRRSWQLGLAAEILGAMQSALRLTIDYVTQRQQFGQPIGAMQAVQHRLAECAVLIEGTRWLTFKAADGDDPIEIALALGYAKDAARQVAYDCHQFHGAMGLTLEHPLHLWTYRLRALLGECDFAAAHFDAAACATWGRASDEAA